MTIAEHLLACLIEECAEVSHHTCKALRFGVNDRDPTVSSSPRECEQIISELNDLVAVVELLAESDVLVALPFDRSAIYAKKVKVRHFINYAREHGALAE